MTVASANANALARYYDDPNYGRDVTLIRPGAPVYDIATGIAAPGTATEVASRGIILNYRNTDIDGTLIRRGDRRCLLKAKDLELAPVVGDTLIVGPDRYIVMDIKKHELGAETFSYTLQIRR